MEDKISGSRIGAVVTAGGVNLHTFYEALGGIGSFEVWALPNEVGDRYLFTQTNSFIIGILREESISVDAGEPVRGFSNLDVMLRIGRAAERQLPALVLVPPSVKLPAPTAGVVFASCRVDDPAVLHIHLWGFFAATPTTDSVVGRNNWRLKKSFDVSSAMEALTVLPTVQPALGAQFEALLRNIFAQAGARVTTSPRDDDPQAKKSLQADMAIVPSDDSPEVILIELKAGHLSEKRVNAAEWRLARYLDMQSSRVGLVVYHDLLGRKFQSKSLISGVARISADDLIQALGSGELHKVIADAFDANLRG
jgi:hypothetical protein